MNFVTIFAFVYWLGLGAETAAKEKKSKSVTTLIDAKWEITPIVLEVAEYLADENVAYMWEFIDSICGMDSPLSDIKVDKTRHETVLSKAAELVTPAQISVLKLALALHTYSPKVEMYTQMAMERGLFSTDCSVAADVAGKLVCSLDDVKKAIIDNKENENVVQPEIFDLDHHYPSSENNSLTVILYGELGTSDFKKFHEVLKGYALSGEIDYVLRHFVKDRPERKVRLSGYGVELQIKSTEYKAQDDTKVRGDSSDSGEQEDEEEEIEGFNISKLKSLYPDMKENLEKFRQHLVESSSELAPLKVWQVQELSLQAAERIMAAPREEALKVLTHTAQNFPLQARSLVRTVVRDELKQEIKENQDIFASSLNLQPSDTALFLNGMFFDLDIVDVISLLEVVRQELRVMEGLHKIGVSATQMGSLLGLDFSRSSSSPEFAIDIRDSAITWVNDIEQDKQYRRWSDTLMELLRPTFPGMLRSVRRNLYHLVIIADPAKLEAQPLLKLAESFYLHPAPLRIGLVFAVNPDPKVTGLQDAGVALLNAFNYMMETNNAFSGLAFITDVYAALNEERDVTVEDVVKALGAKVSSTEVDEILGEDTAYDTGRKLSKDFVSRSGFRTLPQALMNGIPLPEKVLNSNDFDEAVLNEIMSQSTIFQKAVYKGELTDADNTLDFIMNQPHVMPRLNERVLGQDSKSYLDMMGTARSVESFETLSLRDKTATLVSSGLLRYFSHKQTDRANTPALHILSYWVVVDLQTAKGRQLLLSALEQMQSSGNIRVGLLLNPETDATEQPLNMLAATALRVLKSPQATKLISSILADEQLAQAISAGQKDISDTNVAGIDVPELLEIMKKDKDVYQRELAIHKDFCKNVLKIVSGARAVIANGHMIGPFETDEDFISDDFSLLERYSMNSYGDKIMQVLKQNILNEEEDLIENSDVLMQAVGLLVSRQQTRSRFDIPVKKELYSVLKLPPRSESEPVFEIAVVVDPVSRGAQKVGPILSVLYEVLNCNIKVYLNCVEKNSDMPLKSFYRFVLEPELQFGPDGQISAGPVARFNNMPTSVLLTQNMHVPENWLVEVVRSPYDLDNIRLDDVGSGVHSEFELEYLLLEGHCFDALLGNPPRGLQITLGTESQPVVVDTIVMANLGYFQLKANPGAWLLRLRQGRSADIFDIVSHEGTDTPADSEDIKVLISSFRSHVIKLKVSKKPGKQHMDLLAEDDQNSGIWNSITSTFGSKSDDEVEDKLNIFSLASGHLYERFLRIMMLSVLKHTKTPVKFWFLKNYLSPTFKDFLPHMAREYQFEYELVQYKWPRWLHQQTEKQRIIWGYKILFLDVLFPLDVKKIIFVDADQVVRADMRELQQLDLGGAPYGYTPFCESRREMDGFRFWKQGYWRNHLQGRRYHISALYVVDLRRFRRIAAGDRLRGQYQALSQDPNSLSNLDQDLPNNMIHQVAIKSLPQEWLWCETWCDDESKKYAKTIDLCNNPLTKEAKLTAANRIVSEWKEYDEEIKKLQKKIDETHTEEGISIEGVRIEPNLHSAHSEL